MVHSIQTKPGRPALPVRPQPFAIIDALEQARDTIGLIAMLSEDGGDLSLVQRRRAVRALANVGSFRAVPTLVNALTDPDRLIRFAAAEGLGRLGEEGTATTLINALTDPDIHVRLVVTDALGRFNTEFAFNALTEALAHKERYVRQGAATALGHIADRRATKALMARLNDESTLVRAAAATALGRIGDTHAINVLEKNRHKTRHPKGQDCGECKAIDAALARLRPTPNADGGADYA